MTLTLSRLVPGVLAAGLLAACATSGADGPRGQAAEGGNEPITARALAAVVAEHLGEPSTAGPATELDERGRGLAAGGGFRVGRAGGSG